jgi:ribosome-associated heat shock protein Hsp15
MRIDKFLWCIRVYKTRSLAASQCKLEKVWLNGAEVKPSREVKLGDVLTVRKGPILFSYKTLAFPRARLGAKLVPTCALDVTAPEEMAKLEMIRMQFRLDRRRGLGRPTKKERRELDDYTDLDFEEEWMSGDETSDES